MDTRDDTIGEVVATGARRGGSDWGHLPQSDLTNLIIGAGFEVDNVLGAGFLADFVVDRRVIVETKVAKAIDPVHRAQVSNYLRASGLEVGLVMNFGSSVQFKRVVAAPRRVQVATKDESKLQRQDNERPHTDEPRSQR